MIPPAYRAKTEAYALYGHRFTVIEAFSTWSNGNNLIEFLIHFIGVEVGVSEFRGFYFSIPDCQSIL